MAPEMLPAAVVDDWLAEWKKQYTAVANERDRLQTAARDLIAAYMADGDLDPHMARLEDLTGGQQR